MVARLPQQVLLLLVLVTGTTTGTVNRGELSAWTTASSTRRVGTSAMKPLQSVNPEGQDAPGSVISHGKRGLDTTDTFSESSINVDLEVTTQMTTSTDVWVSPVLSIPDAPFSSSRKKKIKTEYRKNDWNEEMKEGRTARIRSEASAGRKTKDKRGPASLGVIRFGNEDQSTYSASPEQYSQHGKRKTRVISSSAALDAPVEVSVSALGHKSSGASKPSSSTLLLPASNESTLNDEETARDIRLPRSTGTKHPKDFALPKINRPSPTLSVEGQDPRRDDPAGSLAISSSPAHTSLFQAPSASDESSKKMGTTPRSSGASKLDPTKNEKAEGSSTHYDGYPAHFLYTSANQHGSEGLESFVPQRFPPTSSTWESTALGFPKRYTRETDDEKCEKFMINDDVKREFYSPNYPQTYPPKTNCVRTLEAEKGMLLKLDFRERFELESMAPINDKVGECRYDYLEVRDGQYGFSNLLGVFCDKHFPPEIISKSRHLWLHFHSDDTIEYGGFKAVWSTVPRPTSSGVPPEQEPCIRNITNNSDAVISNEDVQAEKKIAVKEKVALDCLWIITAPAGTRVTFDDFKLTKPNDCSANFLDVFDQRTDIPSRVKNFCGSIAEAVHTAKNTMYIRFYLEPKAINGSFKSLITVVRDKGTTDKPCRDDEYDCDDATCIALSLKCNKRYNCRFLRDEDTALCGTTADQFDSSRVIIILVIFSLIMFGMCFAFVFNCVRKLMRDHRIIREHIRQSRENRLDEIGRKTTPCPVSISRTDLRDRGSESPSVEIDSSKELIPSALIAHEYTKELVLEMKYGTREINDIHQSNNVSNATQERLQESSEELEMRDSSCQTRESLFEPRLPDPALSSPAFSTFGYRRSSGPQNCMIPNHRATPHSEERHQHHQHQHHHHPRTPIRQYSHESHQSHQSNSPSSRNPVPEHCSMCLNSTSEESSIVICPKHNPIPAPPGWSLHDPPHPRVDLANSSQPDKNGCTTYKRYQSPKPDRNPMTLRSNQQHQSPVYTRQNTVGSGERYDSLICGSGRASSNTASNTTTTSNTTGSGSQHSATPKYVQPDPRYRAEAVIEVDQKRPFSIESTKSAPDVIATH